MRAVVWAMAFASAFLLRALIAMAGALAAYGATGMFTSTGIMPPNPLVTVGGLIVLIVAIALWVKERRLEGIWPALLLPAVAYSLYALGSWAVAECQPDHPPITPTYSCAPVGTHAIAIMAPVITLIGLVLLVRDLHALAKRSAPAATAI